MESDRPKTWGFHGIPEVQRTTDPRRIDRQKLGDSIRQLDQHVTLNNPNSAFFVVVLLLLRASNWRTGHGCEMMGISHSIRIHQVVHLDHGNPIIDIDYLTTLWSTFTWLLKITIFHGNTHELSIGPFSTAM